MTLTYDILLKEQSPFNSTSLYLERKRINKIENDSFQSVNPRLSELYLENNEIDEIHSNSLTNFFNLVHLDVSNNKLTSINDKLFKYVTSLSELKLNNNRIEQIDEEAFSNLTRLTYLDLSNNRLSRIDSLLLKNLTNLEVLDLSTNQIDDIDRDAFQDLSSLSSLYISGNLLECIDSDWFKGLSLSTLKRLELAKNKISNIDANSFANLVNLKTLDLSKNRLSRIKSSWFKRLSNLEKLILNDNQIELIYESALEDLTSLKQLYLDGNKMTRIDAILFESMSGLEDLDLTENQIDEIEPTTFSNLVSLKTLYLGNNKLTRIDDNWFRSLSKLEILDLHFNDIKEINKNAFQSLSDIFILYLDNNEISKIERNIFLNLESIGAVTLFNNRFKVVSYCSEAAFDSCLDIFEKSGESYYDVWNRFIQQFSQTAEKNTGNRQQLRILPLSSQKSSSSTNESFDKTDIDPLINQKLFNKRYTVKRVLGAGSFGKVYLVFDEHTGIDKAMKKINSLFERADIELALLQTVCHENVIRYFDHFQYNMSGTPYKCIITEYVDNGDLENQISKAREAKKNFSPDEIFSWLFQATNGLKYLHSINIIHRDIKPANILLMKNGKLKLTDLGIAKSINDSNLARTCIGTPRYMSPEQYTTIFTEDANYSFPADIWALGCVLYELDFLKPAFPYGQTKGIRIPLNLDQAPHFSNILKLMIVIKPEGRIKANRLYDKLYIELKPKYYFLNSDDDKASDPRVNGMKEKSE